MSGFGFVRQIRKAGIERRVFTSGTAKSGLDPFSPLRAAAVQREQLLLTDIHGHFKSAVVAGRGELLERRAAAALSANAEMPRVVRACGLGGLWRAIAARRGAASGAGLLDGSIYTGTRALEATRARRGRSRRRLSSPPRRRGGVGAGGCRRMSEPPRHRPRSLPSQLSR